MDDQTPTDQAKTASQAQIDELERGFSEQMAVTFADPEETAFAKRLEVLRKMQVEEAQIYVRDAKTTFDQTQDPADLATMYEAKRAAQHAVKQQTVYTNRVRKWERDGPLVTRITNLGWPQELRLIILESAIQSEKLRWRATEAESLNAAVDDFLGWPSNINQNMRNIIQDEAGPVMLERAIIELPADFTMINDDTVLDLPSAVLGNEQHIRHLVLDIKLDTRDSAFQRQLNNACRGMESLFLRLPDLEVFVVSLFVGGNRFSTAGYTTFSADTLELRNRTGWTETEDLTTTLVRFLEIFYAKGPGLRKLVRFTEQRRDDIAHAWPLVRVPTFIEPEVQDGPEDIDATAASGAGPSVGEQVLEQAYRYHRTMAFRSAK